MALNLSGIPKVPMRVSLYVATLLSSYVFFVSNICFGVGGSFFCGFFSHEMLKNGDKIDGFFA